MSKSTTKKSALGRGLGALLPSVEDVKNMADENQDTVVGAISNILISQIATNPYQPRTDFDEEALQELMSSIKQQGLIQPVTVRKVGQDKYQLISGERRLRATTQLGFKEIPAYVRVATDGQMLEMALVENIQRDNLNPIEISLSFQALIDECKITHEQVSERVGKNRTTITNYLRLLKLPAEIQLAIRDEKITMGHARSLITLDDVEKQIQILHEIIEKDLSVRHVENLIKNLMLQNRPKLTSKEKRLPELHESFINKFSKKINSAIEINRSQKGKGSIVIPFSSDKEFQRIIDEILEQN